MAERMKSILTWKTWGLYLLASSFLFSSSMWETVSSKPFLTWNLAKSSYNWTCKMKKNFLEWEERSGGQFSEILQKKYMLGILEIFTQLLEHSHPPDNYQILSKTIIHRPSGALWLLAIATDWPVADSVHSSNLEWSLVEDLAVHLLSGASIGMVKPDDEEPP